MVQFQIDDESILRIIIVFFVDLVKGSQDDRNRVDWSAVEEQVMVVLFYKLVFFGTATLYLI